ncbi:MAG: DUF899 family protein [Verrucomicrobiota bacterium]
MSEPSTLHEIEDEIVRLQARLRLLKKEETTELRKPYAFSDSSGEISLSDLFGEKSDLIIIQNMGSECPYCTLYADGIHGVLPHLEDRCAVALLSPDPADVQAKFALSRGWKFRLISSHLHGDDFSKDMGHWDSTEDSEPGVWPGFSAFHRDGDTISRTGHSSFCPGDEYCVVFPMIQLLKESANGWGPTFDYSV